jgi:hypothetical protein
MAVPNNTAALVGHLIKFGSALTVGRVSMATSVHMAQTASRALTTVGFCFPLKLRTDAIIKGTTAPHQRRTKLPDNP